MSSTVQVADRRERVFRFLEGYARRGDQAPSRALLKERYGCQVFEDVTELAKQGRISIEIYGRNYRVIRVGQYATAMPPAHYGAVHTIIDANGNRKVG